MRSALRALSTILIVVGGLLIVDAALTVAWQEPVSAAYARVTQGRLGDDLSELETAAPTVADRRVLRALPSRGRRVAFFARRLRSRAREGQAVGRLGIPRIGLRRVVVQGTGTATLRRGPGHFPETPLPGGRGTVAIAGHRTTYSAPFRRLDDLRRGDPIVVRMPYGRFTYRVEAQRIVAPTEISVIRRVGYDRLVLTACHPLYSAAQRIVVFARLRRVEPLGPAR